MDYIILLVFLFLFIISYIYIFFVKGKRKLNRRDNTPSISVIIPARDESKVIEKLLKSIVNSSIKINSNDVYVVVEDKNDKTVQIVENYGMTIVFREDLTKRRKGYALNDAFNFMKKKNKEYDMYFIFDADNYLDKDYFKNMIETYKSGYDIGVGYRNTINGNKSLVAAASSLTFSMINTLNNERRVKNNLNVIISGTGFYMTKEVIEKTGGYPFNSLTEDYELSIYSIINNIPSTYNNKAIFYDEQPVNFGVSIKQRTRWVKGYFDVRKKYRKEIMKFSKDNKSLNLEKVGVIPYIILVIGIVIFLIINIINLNILKILLTLIILYAVLVFVTFLMLKKEKDYFKLSRKIKVLSLFYNPLFLLSYIICVLKAIFSPDLKWDAIKHEG